jgi:hypothetical protein
MPAAGGFAIAASVLWAFCFYFLNNSVFTCSLLQWLIANGQLLLS